MADSHSSADTTPVVNSWNEWDPLEEIIVGRLEGMAQESWDIARQAVTPRELIDKARNTSLRYGGRPKSEVVPPGTIERAQANLDEFVHILEAEGVTVRRPDPIEHARPYATPDWISPGGRMNTVPRDTLIVLGDEILEAPMSWRSRYFDFLPYHNLCKEYFKRGAKWTACPKPRMTDELYKWDYKRGEETVVTEHEAVFDAADMARCGKDIFVQLSHVTNLAGLEWLRRHYGHRYNFHPLRFDDERAIHIDATFVPLAPGKMMVNPARPVIGGIPEWVKKSGWDILVAPETSMSPSDEGYIHYKWLHLNVLNLDDKRIIVEKGEERLIAAMKDWGFKPIPCNFKDFYQFGGSFHCATVDIRRRGSLQSYF